MRSYPHLGFDPAPGELSAVSSVLESLASAQTQMAECATRLLDAVKIADDSEWGGDAAEEFSDHGDDLPKALDTGSQSIVAVGNSLNTWAGQLAANQAKAEELEAKARKLTDRLDKAGRAVDDAAGARPTSVSHPDYQTAEQDFLAAVAAEARLREELDKVIQDAKRLQAKHDREASAAAEAIRGGPDDAFKPENDGFGVQLLDGISVVSGEVAKWSGTVAAVAAVVPGGQPLAAGLGTVAAGAGAVNTLAGLGQKAAGSSNAPTWGEIALGVVPAKAATSAVRGAVAAKNLRRGALDGAKKGIGENNFVKVADDLKAIRQHSRGTKSLRESLAHKASRDELAKGRELAGEQAGDLKNRELRELARERAEREAAVAALRSPFDGYETHQKITGGDGEVSGPAKLVREGAGFVADPSADRVEQILGTGIDEYVKRKG